MSGLVRDIAKDGLIAAEKDAAKAGAKALDRALLKDIASAAEHDALRTASRTASKGAIGAVAETALEDVAKSSVKDAAQAEVKTSMRASAKAYAESASKFLADNPKVANMMKGLVAAGVVVGAVAAYAAYKGIPFGDAVEELAKMPVDAAKAVIKEAEDALVPEVGDLASDFICGTLSVFGFSCKTMKIVSGVCSGVICLLICIWIYVTFFKSK
jgi:hypothetical protein